MKMYSAIQNARFSFFLPTHPIIGFNIVLVMLVACLISCSNGQTRSATLSKQSTTAASSIDRISKKLSLLRAANPRKSIDCEALAAELRADYVCIAKAFHDANMASPGGIELKKSAEERIAEWYQASITTPDKNKRDQLVQRWKAMRQSLDMLINTSGSQNSYVVERYVKNLNSIIENLVESSKADKKDNPNYGIIGHDNTRLAQQIDAGGIVQAYFEILAMNTYIIYHLHTL